MSLYEDDIIRVAAEIDRILTDYLKIHDDIFKASIRKMIPIPGIFKKIDYKDHNKMLNVLLTDLKTEYYGLENTKILLQNNPDKFTLLNIFCEYVQALSYSLTKLRDICHKFQEKINGERSYSINEYNSDLLTYRESTKVYAGIGEQLNKYFNK